jgi:hypothetical protein
MRAFRPCSSLLSTGLVEEGQEQIDEIEKGPVLDTALIAAAQKVEHYEIAAYGSLIALGKQLGETTAVQLLGETPSIATHLIRLSFTPVASTIWSIRWIWPCVSARVRIRALTVTSRTCARNAGQRFALYDGAEDISQNRDGAVPGRLATSSGTVCWTG